MNSCPMIRWATAATLGVREYDSQHVDEEDHMYLKQVEVIGFKSFAERTVLNFERGMTAVVGPNGCGKSNIADAVRWVLGEQSAKALRGGSMQDVIFSGAETMKPMSMAEVSLTLADCEQLLNVDYNEVTITRRVFRNGDSQYFLNKQPCRLKDIQRTFMDTGVGRGSYSILEQGKIDQILSSRPEDRRLVFEEASGITKYKADRKEAMRKLEQTELNLTRLDDVIREVKRRMISLQRQAGKARRYQEIQDALRLRDLWLTRHVIAEMSAAITALEERQSALHADVEQGRGTIHDREQALEAVRADLERTDGVIAEVMEKAVALRNELNTHRQAIKTNEERIEEMKAYATRDSRDAEEARARVEQHQQDLKDLESRLLAAAGQSSQAASVLEQVQGGLSTLEETAKTQRAELQTFRAKAHQLEQHQARLQQQIRDFDERERGRLVRQERLNGEKKDLEENIAKRRERVAELETRARDLAAEESQAATVLEHVQEKQAHHGTAMQNRRRESNQTQQALAGLRARVDVLRSQMADKEDFPAGARLLLDDVPVAGLDRSRILGTLADQFVAEEGCQVALESALRAWLDAVVLRDVADLTQVMGLLAENAAGAARLLSATGAQPAPLLDGPGEPLLNHVDVKPAATDLAQQWLGNVRLVPSLAGVGPLPVGLTLVTPEGHLLRGDGSGEVHAAERDSGNPLARAAQLHHCEAEQAVLQKKAETLQALVDRDQSTEGELQAETRQAREALVQVQRNVANGQGELQTVRRELSQAEQRLTQVQAQIEDLLSKHGGKDEERARLMETMEAAQEEQGVLRRTIDERSAAFEQLEQQRNQAARQVTEHRIRVAELRQQNEMLERQMGTLRERISEFQATIQERISGVSRYEERVERLRQEMESAAAAITPLEAQLAEQETRLGTFREERAAQQARAQAAEQELRGLRQDLEKRVEAHGRVEVDLAERRVRYENTTQRVTEAYHVTLADVQSATEPEWERGEVPGWDVLAAQVQSMRDKLEEMGPVNLVAIEEFQEQEDRYQFLAAQQEDLLQAKEQWLEMIRKINLTTTELFTETFQKVNENFQRMFKQLFGGGEAELRLLDAEDVLESGIDIVARPPGKKPQTISLLSGGERTMTAVALLFSLYLVKPSPFCVLDELDAALDDANIGRFVAMLQEFLKSSQFIVITHNQKTIAAADVLYGVTQQRKGISKLVSVKLTDHDKDEGDVRRSKQLPETADV